MSYLTKDDINNIEIMDYSALLYFPELPRQDPDIRIVAIPSFANSNGIINGGWIMTQADYGAGMYAQRITNGHVVTKKVTFNFIAPVKAGELLSVFCDTEKIGKTSVALTTEVWANDNKIGNPRIGRKILEGKFTFVAIDETGKARLIG